MTADYPCLESEPKFGPFGPGGQTSDRNHPDLLCGQCQLGLTHPPRCSIASTSRDSKLRSRQSAGRQSSRVVARITIDIDVCRLL